MRSVAGIGTCLVLCAVSAWSQPAAVPKFSFFPQSFEPNRGQAEVQAEYVARGQNYSLTLSPGQARLNLASPNAAAEAAHVNLKLLNSNRGIAGTAVEPQSGTSNYFIGNNPSAWLRDIPHFGRIEYRAVYEGIDLAYYGTGEQLEYDFIVNPHASASSIQMEFQGAKRIRIDKSGDLILSLGKSEIRERKPVAYQDTPDGRIFRSVRYIALGQNRIGFRPGSYDASLPLIIDPVLVFSSFFGGTGSESGNRSAVDSAGNSYYAGSTSSSALSGTKLGGAFSGGGTAGFVAKVSPSGALVYATFIAGTSDVTSINGMTVDANGNVYATGSTRSGAFPTTTGVNQTVFGGGVSDAFIFELNSAGSNLIFSTFLGGNGQDYTADISVDSVGTVYVAGSTKSTNFPLHNAYQNTNKSPNTHTTFAAKISPGGTSLLYSTYLGGSGGDYNNGMTIDGSGNQYIYGDTTSLDFPAVNALQATPCGGTAGHGWVAQLNSAGTPVYSTYICASSADDAVRGAAVDGAGNLVITGATSSTAYTATAGAVQAHHGGGTYDMFILQLSPSGALLYCSYLGGNGNDAGLRLAVDPASNWYITGNTSSSNYPVSANATQVSLGGSQDAVLTKINSTGTAILFSTYLGGANVDAGNGVVADGNGQAYIAGQTASANSFPRVNPFQSTFGGGANDAFFAVLATCDFTLSSLGSVPVTGATGTITLGTTPECGWTTASSLAWVSLSPATGTGNGSVAYSIAPNPGGARNGNVNIANQSVAVSQAGVIAPTSLTFASQGIGVASTAQAITFTAPGPGAASISGISFAGTNPGDFTQNNTCTGALTPGTTCTISVTFTPSASGARSASLSISGSGFSSPLTVNLSGTGTASTVALSPASLAFGNQSVNIASTSQTVTVTNSGPGLLTISSIGFTGANTGDFTQTNNCPLSPATLAVSATCTVNVTFMPLASGARSASLSIADNGTSSPQTAGLTGTGVIPTVALSPSTLSFGSQTLNTTSAAQTVTVTNNGPGVLGISSIGLTGTNSGDYSQTNNCPVSPATLAVASSCTVTVTFTPTVAGASSASLNISDNGVSSPQLASLSGTGMAPPPVITFSPTSLSFGNQTVATASSPTPITVTNTGPGSLLISSIAITGVNNADFSQTNTCPVSPSTLALNATCTINVTFTPSASGARSAAVTLTDNGAGSPQSVNVSGTGAVPAVTLSPATVSFGTQNVNTTSPATPVTLTNAGPGLLTISAIAITGTNNSDFGQTNTCPVSPATLAVNASCTVNVTFTPSAGGSRSASLSITDNGGSSPQTVGLSGTGVLPVVTLSPASLSFADQTVNTTSAATPITVTNAGPGILTISTIGISGPNAGDFGQSNNCPVSPATLAVNATCTVNVTFKPTASGARSASLSITDSGASSPQTAALSGNGAIPVVALAPTSLSFGTQNLNTSSNPTPIAVTNNGPGLLTISSIGITGTNAGDFGQSNNCPVSPATLAVNASCTVNVTFTPTTTGTRSASLSITDNGASSPQTAGLSGTGAVPVVTLAPTSLTFAAQNLNTTSGAQPITVTNAGPGILTISTIGISGANAGDFGQTNNCPVSPATLAVNASCTVNVTFTPIATGTRSASLSITDNGASSPQTAGLSGTGAVPVVTLAPSSLTFAAQNLNTTSGSQPITMTNAGPGLLTISTIGISGSNAGDFAQSNNCPVSPATLAVNASCTVNVTFTPTATGTRSASLSITDNGASSPQTAGLSGTGAVPVVTLAPTSLTFAAQNLNTTSGAQPITVTNAGPGILTISTIGISGPNAGDFGQSNNCPVSPATLAVNASCTVNVTFTPTATGSRSASLSITDNGASSPQTAGLSGTGAVPVVTLAPSSLTFAAQNLNTTSGAQPITVTNAGPGILTISTIGISGPNAGDFGQSNNCPVSPATLAVNASCTVNVTFTPTGTGTRSASLSITDNGASSPQTAGLSGTGAVPVVTLSPTSLTFAAQNLNTTSGAQQITVTNAGPGVLTISSLGISGTNAGDFSQTNTCPLSPSTLAVNASCTVNVTFTPTATGTRSASLSITDNGASSPQTAGLSGTGALPTVTLAPSSLTFGAQNLNTTSGAQPITVTNAGPGLLTVSTIGISGSNAGDFAQSNNCPVSPATLAVNASCTVNVTFTPTATGSRSASLSITDNGASSPQVATLSGTGGGSTVTLSPASVGFGSVAVSVSSTSQNVTVTNGGPGSLTISSIGFTGTNPADFSQTNNCPLSPASLAAGSSCSVSVTFTPTASGSRSAKLALTDNGTSSPQTMSVSGTGVVPTVIISPTSLSFGDQTVGTTSPPQTLTIKNNGPGLLLISSVVLAGSNPGAFLQSNNCPISPATLAVGSSCTATVSFIPNRAAARSASLTLTDNGVYGSQYAGLSGNGVVPVSTISPSGLSFGGQTVGTTSTPQTLTITNTGPGALTITAVSISGVNAGDYSQTNNCIATLPAGGTCTVNVIFRPSATGSRSGTVAFTGNGSGTQSAPLSGTGT